MAYSTPQGAYEKIITAFNATDTGRAVTFTKSFGAVADRSATLSAASA